MHCNIKRNVEIPLEVNSTGEDLLLEEKTNRVKY
jgi:hypothetical protein